MTTDATGATDATTADVPADAPAGAPARTLAAIRAEYAEACRELGERFYVQRCIGSDIDRLHDRIAALNAEAARATTTHDDAAPAMPQQDSP